MVLKQSYIFVKDKYKENSDTNFKNIFKELFELDEEFIKLGKSQKYVKKNKIDYLVTFNGKVEENTYYLNIKLDGEYDENEILILEDLDKKINSKKNSLEKSHICINSYSEISQYYCNLIYEDLSRFERNLRQLMFNIYISNFNEEFLYKTTDEKVSNKMNYRTIYSKSKDEEEKNKELVKKAFYNLDYNCLIMLLFEKRWTPLDEEEKNDFLSKHKDLTQLSNEELVDFINSIKPKSDWDRMFADKIKYENIEDDIIFLQGKRNQVAHCKIFPKADYNASKKKLDKLNNSILSAIEETEKSNFAEENSKYILNFNSYNICKAIEKISKKIYEPIQNYNLVLKNMSNAISVPMQNCYKSIENINNAISKPMQSYYNLLGNLGSTFSGISKESNNNEPNLTNEDDELEKLNDESDKNEMDK